MGGQALNVQAFYKALEKVLSEKTNTEIKVTVKLKDEKEN